PTSFYLGAQIFHQLTTNLDLTRPFDLGLRAPVQVSWGLEHRWEEYLLEAGQPESYESGGYLIPSGQPNAGKLPPAGLVSFTGTSDQDAGNAHRNSAAAHRHARAIPGVLIDRVEQLALEIKKPYCFLEAVMTLFGNPKTPSLGVSSYGVRIAWWCEKQLRDGRPPGGGTLGGSGLFQRFHRATQCIGARLAAGNGFLHGVLQSGRQGWAYAQAEYPNTRARKEFALANRFHRELPSRPRIKDQDTPTDCNNPRM
ncbi:MAG: TonB-dependent receptor, partial [Gammaproteobacteria bacterium]|nr:TonB-dependent receptor [Gammaproteobacteria bacterium]